jgi:hypothetical protein
VPYTRCAAVGFIATSIFAWPAIGTESAAAVADLSGLWAREFLGFDPPESGPGPWRTNHSQLARAFLSD